MHVCVCACVHVCACVCTHTCMQVMVFLQTAREAGFCAALFRRVKSASALGTEVYEIHSKKSQPQRSATSEQFRLCARGVLFSSGVCLTLTLTLTLTLRCAWGPLLVGRVGSWNGLPRRDVCAATGQPPRPRAVSPPPRPHREGWA